MNINIKGSLHLIYLSVFIIFSASCRMDPLPPNPPHPDQPYISTDYGVNDYLPLAVGNKWEYQYSSSYTSRVDSYASAYYLIWEVVSVKKSLFGEEFEIKMVRKSNSSDTTFLTSETPIMLRTATYYKWVQSPRSGFHELPLPQSRTGDTTHISIYYGNTGMSSTHIFQKGIGTIEHSWGNFGGMGGSGGGSRKLAKYLIKK